MKLDILHDYSEGSTTFLGLRNEMQSLQDFAGLQGFPGELSAGGDRISGGDSPSPMARLLFRGMAQEAAESLYREFLLFVPSGS